MPTATPTYSIRVVNYWGDFDDLRDLLIIGPYPTRTDRDKDLRRLAGLPDVYGSAQILASTAGPDGADRSATPKQVVAVADLDGLVEALYSHRSAA